MSRLKNEISWLRKKGALKINQELDSRCCGRCQTPFGLLVNRGATCPSCRQRVCKQCREDTLPGREWVCIVCRKQIEIQLATGEWINDFRVPFKCMKEDSSTIPRRQKVRRSWTISDPSSNNKEGDWSRTLSSSVPAKPHRRKGQDENIPPTEGSRERPKRRFSMSSVDSLPRRIKSPSRAPQDRQNSGNRNRDFQSPNRNSRQPIRDQRQSSRDLYQQDQIISHQQRNWRQEQRDPTETVHQQRIPSQTVHQQRIPTQTVHQPYRDVQQPHRDRPPRDHVAYEPQRDTQHISRDVLQPKQDQYYQTRSIHQPRSREPYQQNRHFSPNRGSPSRVIEKLEKSYFFGDSKDSFGNREDRRSSTLPRQPRPTSRSNQLRNEESDIRFHSMPRTCSRTAQSHGIHPGIPINKPMPREIMSYSNRYSSPIRSESLNSNSNMTSSRKPDVQKVKMPSRNLPELPIKQRRDYSVGNVYSPLDIKKEREYNRDPPELPPRKPIVFNADNDYKKELVHKIYMEGDLELEKRMEFNSKQGFSPEIIQIPVKPSREMPISKVSRSNTSISSGYATLGHIGKQRCQTRAPVKRSHSFQPNSNNATPASKTNNTEPRVNVAKFVQEIERRGVRLHRNNIESNPPEIDTRDDYSPEDYYPTDSFTHIPNSSVHLHQIENENNGQADVFTALDSNKMMPDGNNYKLVFISSDSSKDSEQNTSIESDIISSYEHGRMDSYVKQSEIISPYVNAGKTDYINPFHEHSNKQNYVDASVMTVDNSSTDEGSLLDVSIASSLCYPSDTYYERSTVGTLTPMTAMDADEMGLILQQTEVVQAEAQALQQVLMSAFEVHPEAYKHDFDSNSVNDILNMQPYIAQLTNRSNLDFFNCDSEEKKEAEPINRVNFAHNEPNKIVPQFTLKEKRNVAIQANLSIASSESDASEQESYYDSSMVDSEDDTAHYECQNRLGQDGTQNNALHIINSDNNRDKSCLKEEGQNTLIHQPYLSGYPSAPPKITSPYNHLQLTLNRENSVSVWRSESEGCEVPSIPTSNSNVNIPVVIKCDQKSENKVIIDLKEASCGEQLSNKNKSPFNSNSHKSAKNYNGFKSVSQSIKFPLSNPPIFPKLSEIKMNSESNKEYGDINAIGKVISDPLRAPVHAPLQADEESPSSTSDEDTDEEKHVSRTYNINDCVSSDNEKSSGTSDTNSECESDTHSLDCGHIGDNIKTNNDSSDLNNKQVTGTEQRYEHVALDRREDNEEVSSDSEMKLYLPECDQNIVDSSINTYNNESVEANIVDKVGNTLSDIDNDSCDTSESVVENKSETESNIGMEVESVENREADIINIVPKNAEIALKIIQTMHDSQPQIHDELETKNFVGIAEKDEPDNISITNKNNNNMSTNTVDTSSNKENCFSNDITTNADDENNVNYNIIPNSNIEIFNVINFSKLENKNRNVEFKMEENDLFSNEPQQKSIFRESAITEIAGSRELERTINSCENEPVLVENLSEKGVTLIEEKSDFSNDIKNISDNNITSDFNDQKYSEQNNFTKFSESCKNDVSSDRESVDIKNSSKQIDKLQPSDTIAIHSVTQASKESDVNVIKTEKLTNIRPIPPLRRAKRSSSSDGLSSSSDLERSDIDASDSADTIIENANQNIFAIKSAIEHNKKQKLNSHQSGSDSHCSDNSDEGNLVSIVAVGEEASPKPQSQGKIYITSNSTDSAVQINPTCIVLTGDSSTESESDIDSDNFTKSIDNCDITVLDVNDIHGSNHVMSFKVTSPESSRCPSPTKNKLSELQSMMRNTQETQQEYRSQIGQRNDASSLTNYFTVTLGSDSPALPRRTNKTPEVRRRKISDGIENTDTSSTPSQGHTPSPTLSPSPNNLEEHTRYYEDSSRQEIEDQDENSYVDYYNDDSDLLEVYGEQYDTNMKDNEGNFDSIEEFESIEESNYSETSSEESYDREEEIRYAKRSYNFALHTILEESCEDSDYDKKEEAKAKHDQSELEKYFYFGLGNGPDEPKKYANEESEYSDTFSETSSSAYSEGVDSMENEGVDPEDLASSLLEKYFKDVLNFERQPSIRSVGEESEIHTDESGSVGSDSEGSPSPEQPRKKLFRSRGVRSVTSRSHGYSSDKGEGVASDGSHHSGEQDEISDKTLVSGEDEGSTESEEIAFEKCDGQFDTIKRRKKKKGLIESDKKHDSDKAEVKSTNIKLDENIIKREQASKENIPKKIIDGLTQIQNEKHLEKDCSLKQKEECFSGNDLAVRKYQSRDSGFIGSSDDLLKDKPDDSTKEINNQEQQTSDSSSENKFEKNTNENQSTINTQERKYNKPLQDIEEQKNSENKDKCRNEIKVSRSSTGSSADRPISGKEKEPQTSNLSRKDSFNWSSDEETNIMMSKMRMFFKNMFSHTHSNNGNKEINKGLKIKSPQLMMFETKLTNLMRTVPGINDEQVKEIVDYLSSEDTWSDSYDSSDCTSSDREGAHTRLKQDVTEIQSEVQKQISVSCQQIIENFDQGKYHNDVESTQKFLAARSLIENNGEPSNKETFFMYHKLMSSITHGKLDSDRSSIGSGSQSTSPPLLSKVMHYIGNRLVDLMHEVSVSSENGDDVDFFAGDNLATSSPRQKLFLPKKYKYPDSISLDSSVDKNSITSTSFESEDSPTDTENSPESEIGTPKAGRHNILSVIKEKPLIEDVHTSDHQKHSYSPSESIRYNQFKKSSAGYNSHKITEERAIASSYSTDTRNKDFESWRRSAADDRIDVREQGGVSKALSRSGRRADSRKARSHMSLEKIHQEDVKNTGERSESLGDLLDRVKSSGFSSSYEQLDSDSTLRASDSLDRHIDSSSSNIRLNASSRGSLNTSSRGSLAASSRGSLNASSRGSLQGSSGPDEDDDKKSKKTSFFRNLRRSNNIAETKEPFSREIRSTTLPRSTPTHILPTGTLPRSNQPPSQLFTSKLHSAHHVAERNPPSTGPKSARYHPPGYRPPNNSNLLPKRTISTPMLKNNKSWHTSDDSHSYSNDSPSVSMSVGSLPKASLPNSATGSLRGGIGSSNSSRTASPLGGSLGRASAGSLASFENLPDEEVKRSRIGEYRRNNSLSTLGLKSRSDSMASVCSNGGEGRYGAVSVMGEVRFALQYNYKEGQLECHVIGCRDLAPVDTRKNRSDPYVKAYLLPDKSKAGKKKTKVKRHTLSPVFEEILKFQTTLSDLESRTLWLSVWHYGMFGRNDFLGEVLLRLDDSTLEDSSLKWYPLQDRTEVMEEGNYGAILIIALKFVPPDALAISGIKATSGRRRSRGALQVRIKEASGLVGIKNSQNPPDPICKGILLPEKGKTSKQKTSVCRKTSNPHWNHTMTFDDVTLQELTERALEISILDHDRFGSSEFMGGCRFNLGISKAKEDWMDASGLEQKLWQQMLERPNLWVESSLLLRSSIDRPIYSVNFTE